MAPGEKLRTSEVLKVNNSAYRRELMIGSDTPEMRAATMALSAFIGPPTYSELRTRQQLGYIASGGAGGEDDTLFAYFIVQSSDYPADVLQARTDAFIATLPHCCRPCPTKAGRPSSRRAHQAAGEGQVDRRTRGAPGRAGLRRGRRLGAHATPRWRRWTA